LTQGLAHDLELALHTGTQQFIRQVVRVGSSVDKALHPLRGLDHVK